MKIAAYLFIAITTMTFAHAHDDGDPRLLVLRGEYTVIGTAHTTGKPYRGTITLYYENAETLSVTRTINGKVSHGSGRIIRKAPSEIDEFLVTFTENNKKYSAVYMMQSDHDNYTRFTGYVFVNDVNEENRGIEALFPLH